MDRARHAAAAAVNVFALAGPAAAVSTRLALARCLAALVCAASAALAEGLTATELRTEWLTNPLAVDAEKPRLSWRVQSDRRGAAQTAYRIVASTTEERLSRDEADVWDSGKVQSAETLGIAFGGAPVAAGRQVFWKVNVWDEEGGTSAWSEPARWAAGLRDGDWKAQWISFKDDSPVHARREELHLPAARHYRKEFTAKPVKRAVLYASALGLCEMHLNGKPVSDAYFEPGWSDYRARAYYRAHEVTSTVTEGANVLGAIVADGWYAGYFTDAVRAGHGPHQTGRSLYGKTPALLAQLELEYADGSRETIGTDATWQVSGEGPIREADLAMGEAFDRQRDDRDWCRAGGTQTWTWHAAVPAAENGSVKAPFRARTGEREVELGFQQPKRLQAYSAPPIRATQEIPAKAVTELAPGVHIFDLGQNIAGNIRLRTHGEKGLQLKIRYGEMLHPDGRLMTETGGARATDSYTLAGSFDGEAWTPRFSHHRFRYVEITGLAEKPSVHAVTGLPVHHDTPLTSRFECSDPMVNQLFQNIVWTQRSNFVEVPGSGALTPAQLFAHSATFNADVAAFSTKWLDDVQEAQHESGVFAEDAPDPLMGGSSPRAAGSAGSVDAGIIIPWTMWRMYGDTRLIKRHWEGMCRFMSWRHQRAPELRGVKTGHERGDWLHGGEPTPTEYLDACYHALVARLMSDMAEALGRKDESAAYRKLYQDIREAFQKDYLKPDGTLAVETQTAHALGLAFGLVPAEHALTLASQLAKKIEQNGFRISTGIVGMKPLLPVLSALGHHDIAVRLVQSRNLRSWGHTIEQGATTVWERWEGSAAEAQRDGDNDEPSAGGNSLNHLGRASVCEWMFRFLAGIDTDEPGYKSIIIRPGLSSADSGGAAGPIDWVRAEYSSVRGPISTSWKRAGNAFDLETTIPANTTATVYLPAKDADAVTESGRPLSESQDVRFLRMERDRAVLAITAGTYRFETSLK